MNILSNILDTNIESVVYILEPDTEVEVKYYKHIPENGMSWSCWLLPSFK